MAEVVVRSRFLRRFLDRVGPEQDRIPIELVPLDT